MREAHTIFQPVRAAFTRSTPEFGNVWKSNRFQDPALNYDVERRAKEFDGAPS